MYMLEEGVVDSSTMFVHRQRRAMTCEGNQICILTKASCQKDTGIKNKEAKTYNRRGSQMVTHSSSSRPAQCLCMAERTESFSITFKLKSRFLELSFEIQECNHVHSSIPESQHLFSRIFVPGRMKRVESSWFRMESLSVTL